VFNYLKKFNQKFFPGYANLGRMIYAILKQYYPPWIKIAYRTYHSPLLNGYLINQGITKEAKSVVSRPSMEELKKRDAYIRMLNENVKESAVLDRIIPPPPVQSFSRPMVGTQVQGRNVTQAPQMGATTVMNPSVVPMTTNVGGIK
jgi:hypothetical protein